MAKGYTLIWQPDKLKKEILKTLQANAQDVGDFVASDARHRVLAMRNMPAWEKYRRKMVAGGIDFEVENKGTYIEIRVGVKTSERSRKHGLYLELGRHNLPPSPFLRPTVFMNAKKIIALLSGKD